jgi:hypothetical protein
VAGRGARPATPEVCMPTASHRNTDLMADRNQLFRKAFPAGFEII